MRMNSSTDCKLQSVLLPRSTLLTSKYYRDWSAVRARTWSDIVETPTKRLNTERELKKPSVAPTGNPTKSSPKAWARLDYTFKPEHLVDAMHGECKLEIRPVEEHDAILSHYVTPLDDPVSSFATDFSRCPEF